MNFKKIFCLVVIFLSLLLIGCNNQSSDYKFELNDDQKSYTLRSINYELNNVEIPETYKGLPVTKINFYSMRCNSKLESVYIPKTIKYIPNSLFEGCSNLNSIIISNENKYYDSRENCNAVIEKETNKLIAACKYTVIPDTVEIIGEYAFRWVSISEIEVPSSVHTIERRAFLDTDLDYINLPEGLLRIEENAFEYCLNLRTVKLPNSLEYIGNYAFSYCPELRNLEIPKSVYYIGVGITMLCSKLDSIVVADENKFYDSRENCNCIIETSINKIVAGCNNSVILPGIEKIGEASFVYYKFEEVLIPSSVTEIGKFAFWQGVNVKKFEFEDNNGWYYYDDLNKKINIDFSDNDKTIEFFKTNPYDILK